MDTKADKANMDDAQDLDIFATAAYQIIHKYFDITLYRPSNDQVIFYAHPRLRKPGWKWKLKKRLKVINARVIIRREKESYKLTVSRTHQKISRPPLLNLLLFALTFLSVLITSSYLQHGDQITEDPALIWSGLPFTVTLLVILLVHEMGHFWAGYKRGVVMSYPFFIPAPTFLGTFGAIIKSRTPIKDKNDLILIGAAGPLAGAIPAIIAMALGYALSAIIELPAAGMMTFGDSLLTSAIRFIVIGSLAEPEIVLLSQIAQAGKVGLLITMINLLPLGQLDGGHILYGLLGKKQHWIAILFLICLAGFGFIWKGWWLWLVLAIIMKPFHPPVINDDAPPDKRHKIIGWIAVLLFLLTFVPAPISVN
ncbi:MAG: site-2 protease family protein [candidate division Zixibacteria bacterium]|nr:site-2 protease family protein [candidate division Zixibacteria bacterium]